MKGKGITQRDLGDLLGIKSGTISYRIRNNAFKDHDIDFICKSFGINADWVKMGLGDVYLEEKDAYNSKTSENAKIQDRSVEYYSFLVGGELDDIIKNEKDYSKKMLIERIRDLEIKLLQAIDGEKLAVKRERKAIDKYMELLEKSKK